MNYTILKDQFCIVILNSQLKRLLVIVIFLYFGLRSYAQQCDNKGLDLALSRNIIYEQFGSLINKDSKTQIGNFAALDLKEASVDFNGNIMFDGGSILAISAKGAITDGFLPIFTNNELNTDLGFSLQYNFLQLKNKIRYESSECEKYYASLRKINNEYEIKRIEIVQGQKKNVMQLEMEKLSKKLASLETKKNKALGFQKDSLSIEISKIKENVNYRQQQINYLPSIDKQLDELMLWKDSEELKARQVIMAKTVISQIGWFSFGYAFSNSEFRLFNPKALFDSQVTKTTYDTHKANVQYSFYRNNPLTFQSYFITVGGRYALENNFTDLDKVEISENSAYGSPPVTRSKTAKYTAYEGEYLKDINSISLYADLYWFLFSRNQAAVHIYPEQKFSDKLKPLTNFGLGFMLAFKNKEKNENKINTELYINFLDMANNQESKNDFIERSSYGLRFTFPINF